MRVRTIAAGITLAALAGSAVPLAMSGSASAKGSGAPSTVAITKCTPVPAIIGKTVTIHGTDLGGVTKVKIGSKNVTAAVTTNTDSIITVSPVPGGFPVTPNAATIKVSTANGKATGTCTFQKAKKSKKS